MATTHHNCTTAMFSGFCQFLWTLYQRLQYCRRTPHIDDDTLDSAGPHQISTPFKTSRLISPQHPFFTILTQIAHSLLTWTLLTLASEPFSPNNMVLLPSSSQVSTSPVNFERKYDVGDQELLAMKATIKEWHHWLEGAKHPFLVLTNHRNLDYLHTTKRLNTRQARWALFFTCFNFTVTYHPGSKNIKANHCPANMNTQNNVIPKNPLYHPRLPLPDCPSSKTYVPYCGAREEHRSCWWGSQGVVSLSVRYFIIISYCTRVMIIVGGIMGSWSETISSGRL